MNMLPVSSGNLHTWIKYLIIIFNVGIQLLIEVRCNILYCTNYYSTCIYFLGKVLGQQDMSGEGVEATITV